MSVNKLTRNLETYDPKTQLVFSDVFVGNIPDSKLKFRRINLFTKHPDGSCGDLIVRTGWMRTFGLNENKDLGTGSVNGYTLSHCMWDRNGATPEQKALTDFIDRLVEACKDYLLDNKSEIDKYDLDRTDLKKLNPLYWKKDKGVPIPGYGPTLYPKTMLDKSSMAIRTEFYDMQRNKLDPLTVLNVGGRCNSTIKFENIFIGTKISLQFKVLQCQLDLDKQLVSSLLFDEEDNHLFE